MCDVVREFPRFDRSFENLKRGGWIDLHSGAWDHPSNVRKAHCGRCGSEVPKGRGKPYNQFRADGFQATTKYLCPTCAENVL